MTKLVGTECKHENAAQRIYSHNCGAKLWIDLRCPKLDRKKIGTRRRGAQLKKILDPDWPR
jgi:hypothetical protein